MKFFNLYLLSTYLKKWSYHDHRISLNYSYSFEDGYDRHHVDMRIGSPVNMINELLNHVFHRAKERIQDYQQELDPEAINGLNNIILVNESEIKRKLSIFISKILKEFNANKRSRGRSRMISTRSLDFYYNDFEFEPLDEKIKFYVHLNRGINKMSGDLWTNAVEDIKQALAIDPENTLANKHMAISLNKLGMFEEALVHLRKYAENEGSAESLDALASGYMHIGQYDDAITIYKQLEKKFPDSLVAQLGRAQVAYKQGKGYRQILDRIYNSDPEWLKEKLRSEWEYKLPGYADNEEGLWNAATAARYLGFERPFDLTRKAFNEDIPCYFDSERGTIRFARAELDNWVEIMNRYKVDTEQYETFEDRLTAAEIQKAQKRRKKKRRAVNDAPLTVGTES